MTFPNDHCKSESSGLFLPVSSFVNQERDCLCCSSYEDKIRRSGKMILNRGAFFFFRAQHTKGSSYSVFGVVDNGM